MKRFIVSVIACAALALPLSASAVTLEAGRTLFVSQETTIEDVYAVSGGTVDLAGTFKNDVLVGGGTVTIRGPVDGDVLVGGGTVKISSEVKGSVRVVGGTLELDSKVGRNVILIGGTLTTGSQTDVQGQMLLLGGSASLSGHVVGNVDAWAGSATLNAVIDGSVMVNFGPEDPDADQQLILGPQTVIAGDLTYYAKKEVDLRSGAVVKGMTTKHEPGNVSTFSKEFVTKFFTFARLWNLFSLLVVAALLVLVFPKTLRLASEGMLRRKGAAFGWGLLVFLAAPVTFVILPFTLIGIPLMLMLLAVFAIGMYVSQIVLGFVVGTWLLRLMQGTRAWTMSVRARNLVVTFLGIIVISLIFDFLFIIGIIPAGLAATAGLVRFGLTIWSFGGLLLAKTSYLKDYEQT